MCPGDRHPEALRPRRVREPPRRPFPRVSESCEPPSFRHVDLLACPSTDRKRGAVVRDYRGGGGVDCIDVFLRGEDAQSGERARDAPAPVYYHLSGHRPVGLGGLSDPEVFVVPLYAWDGPAVH